MDLEISAVAERKRNSSGVRSRYLRDSEQGLVNAARAGHAAAFEALCERHARQLQRATYRISRNREDSEDAVQDALLRAFLHMKDFDGRSSFATWLTRIAINSALMNLRKKRTSREVAISGSPDSGADNVIYQIADRAPNPEKRYAQREKERMLQQAIRGLRPTLRKVVEMKQLQERSMQETAEAMSISVAAAKARLFHAKRALRRSSILKPMYRPQRGTGKFGVASAA